jgi:predicted CXXCH cytochrome family protein
MRMTRLLRIILPVVVVGFVLAACTTEKIVYRDREPFNEPVAAAAGFLGYYTAESKSTTCGNCHVGHQSDWVTTRHADAYATLPATAQEFCKSCHSVSSNGNIATGTTGYDATQDAVYHDVQCESCHGPGLAHVQNPEVAANVPLANANLNDDGSSCAACHAGNHHPFVEQWELSRHSEVVASAAARAECATCHEGKTALLRFSGQDPNFRDKGDTEAWPTTCTVCHDPHADRNAGQLRLPVDNPDPEQNLCMQCHIRRIEPAGGSRYGNAPHAPQGAALIGIAGYRPAGFAAPEDEITSTHGSAANQRLCATCHVNMFTVTDPQGGFVFQAVGHTFGALPCVDAQGVPSGNSGCDYNTTARSFGGCVGSGCHSTQAVASTALFSLRTQMNQLANQLWVDTDGDETIDAAPTDGGMLAIIKRDFPGAINASDNIISPADGAEFNVKLFGEGRYANGDKSLGVHNPFLAKALLAANIAELQATYGVSVKDPSVMGLVQESIDAVRRRQPELFRTGHGN